MRETTQEGGRDEPRAQHRGASLPAACYRGNGRFRFDGVGAVPGSVRYRTGFVRVGGYKCTLGRLQIRLILADSLCRFRHSRCWLPHVTETA